MPERDVCLADASDEIAGYLRCWPFVQADGLHLYAQFGVMAPHGRRRGIGRALQVAGQVRTYVDATWNRANGVQRGWTEFISMGESWRRRGRARARALILRSLRAQRDAGMTESGLGVDTHNLDGALRVYESCGFVAVQRHCVHRKPLLLD